MTVSACARESTRTVSRWSVAAGEECGLEKQRQTKRRELGRVRGLSPNHHCGAPAKKGFIITGSACAFFCKLFAASEMKLKHLESALQSVTTYSELGTDKVNIELEQYR